MSSPPTDIVGNLLDQTGLRSKLKSELRYQLIESLRSQQKIQLNEKKNDLRDKALYSAVLELLKKRNKLYALSVLTPECGLKEGDIFSKSDMCKALGIEPYVLLGNGSSPAGSPMDVDNPAMM